MIVPEPPPPYLIGNEEVLLFDSKGRFRPEADIKLSNCLRSINELAHIKEHNHSKRFY